MFPSPSLMCHMDSIQPYPVTIHIGLIGWKKCEISDLHYAGDDPFILAYG